ncbi:hypothetical protein [Streptomyces sp. NPDC001480]|uniref:hypothetical protein n=1 Tax=Streptomyces sp. NPDC001480 TaxID=3364577 RepID=UPI0036A049BA
MGATLEIDDSTVLMIPRRDRDAALGLPRSQVSTVIVSFRRLLYADKVELPEDSWTC